MDSCFHSNEAKISFQTMRSKIEQAYKKLMQVEVDVKFVQTNFGGHGYSSFGDFATFQFGQISLSDHGL